MKRSAHKLTRTHMDLFNRSILSFGTIIGSIIITPACGSKSSKNDNPPPPDSPASTSTTTGTATSTSKTAEVKPKYTPQNVPAAIAPTIPSSIGNKKGSQLTYMTAQSHGFEELNYQFQTMKDDLNETTLYLMLGDSVYNDALASCNNTLPCTAKNLKAKVTQEIANAIKSLTDSSYDETAAADSGVGEFKVGDEVPIESLTIRENVKFGTVTYKKCLKFGGQEKDDNDKPLTNWTSEICFNESRTKVFVHDLETGKLPDMSDPTKKVNYDSKYTATFNLDNGVFQSKSSMQYGKSKFANDLMVDSRSESELAALKAGMTEDQKKAFVDKDDIFVVANISGDEPAAGGPYMVKIEAFVDDDGGVVKAAYTLSTITITGANFSASVDTDTYYLMIPPGVTQAQIENAPFEAAIGSLYTDSSPGALDFTKDELDYWGPPTVPTGVKLYKLSVDDSGKQVIESTSITLSSITSTKTQDTDWYQEKFNNKGTLLGWCSTEDEGGTAECGGESLTEDLKKIPSTGIKVPGAIVVSFGSTLTSSGLAAHDFVVLTSSKSVAGVSPADVSSYIDDVLVVGQFKGNPASLQTDGVGKDYRIVITPGLVKSDFDNAKIYKFDFDSTTGNPKFTALTGHTINVTEVN